MHAAPTPTLGIEERPHVAGTEDESAQLVRGHTPGEAEHVDTNHMRKTYGFEPDGKGFCARNEDFTPGRFSSPVHNKDDYLTSDCSNPRARRVLEFLVPILLPDKGAPVTVGIASLILGSLEKKRQVDWGLVFYGTVRKMVTGLEGTKTNSLTPFL